MATLENTHQKYIDLLDTYLIVRGEKFLSPVQKLLLLNAAAVEVAADLGGLKYFYEITTVADQLEYTLPNTITKLESPAWVVDNPGTATEDATPFDIFTFQEFQALKESGGIPDQCAWYSEENSNILNIVPAFDTAGRTIQILCKGYPNVITASVTLYDGDIAQINAVCLRAASLAKFRSRDYREAQALENRAALSVEKAAHMESIKNQSDGFSSAQETPYKELLDY